MPLPSFQADGAEPAALGETQSALVRTQNGCEQKWRFTHTMVEDTMQPKGDMPKIAGRACK